MSDAKRPQHTHGRPRAHPGESAHKPGSADADRLRRRARFLRELAEARELRERVQPRRARIARLRRALRARTFRW